MLSLNARCSGGFGFNKTTLSERQGAVGVAGEYQYVADPIHQAVRKPADAEAAAVKPFKPANPPPTGGPGTVTRNFGGRPTGAVGEFAWQPRPEAPAGAVGSSAGAEPSATADAAEAAAASQSGAPFKPVSVPHTGPMATFDKFPGECAIMVPPEQPQRQLPHHQLQQRDTCGSGCACDRCDCWLDGLLQGCRHPMEVQLV